MRLLAILLALALPLGASADGLGQPEILVQSDHVVALPFSAPGQLGLGFLPQQDHIRMACWPGIADGTPDAWECLARGPEGGVSDLAPVTVGNATACGTTEGLGGSTAWGPITDACAPYIAAADAAALGIDQVWTGAHTVSVVAYSTDAYASTPIAFSHGLASADGMYVNEDGCIWSGDADIVIRTAASQTMQDQWRVRTCSFAGGTFTQRTNGVTASLVDAMTVVPPTGRNLYFGRYTVSANATGGPLSAVILWDTALTATESATPESLTWGAVGDDLRVVSEGRATSKTCGTQTIGPNAPCVTADGLLVETGDSPTVSTAGWPVEAGEVEVEVSRAAPVAASTFPRILDTAVDDLDGLIIYATNTTVYCVARNAGVSGAAALVPHVFSADTPAHIACRWGGGKITITVDGASNTVSSAPPGSHGTAHLGHRWSGSQHWDGYIRLLGVKAR